MVKRRRAGLDRTFAALADPTRRRILQHLAQGDQCVTRLARPHPISLPAISRHLRVLESAGLISRQQAGRVHQLTLQARPMKQASAWMENIAPSGKAPLIASKIICRNYKPRRKNMTARKNDPAHAAAPNELKIVRIFEAPRALVYKMFTEIEHALAWGGPREYPMVHLEADLRPGGKWRGCLRAKESGEEMWQGGVYREIVPLERLVYTFAWDEESGNSPNETLVTIIFADEGDGKTKMTFRQAPFTSDESREGHCEGWNSAFDRLDELLKKLKSGERK